MREKKKTYLGAQERFTTLVYKLLRWKTPIVSVVGCREQGGRVQGGPSFAPAGAFVTAAVPHPALLPASRVDYLHVKASLPTLP